MKIENGKKYVFNTTDTALTKYNGTEVEVIRPLTGKECDITDIGNMYKIKFEDGYVRDAFEDELATDGKRKVVIKEGVVIKFNNEEVTITGIMKNVGFYYKNESDEVKFCNTMFETLHFEPVFE